MKRLLLILHTAACLSLQDMLPNSTTVQTVPSTWTSYQQPAVVFMEVLKATDNTVSGVFASSAPGLLFASTEPIRIPCTEDTACCVREFTSGFLVTDSARQLALACGVGPIATDYTNPNFTVAVRGNTFTVNTTTPIATIGLAVMLSSGPALTWTTVRSHVAYDRRMVSSVVLQLESDPTRTWARAVMSTLWPNTTLVSLMWRTNSGPWQSCNTSAISTCPEVGPACVGQRRMDSLQVWIPGVGPNTTMWATVRSGSKLGRVMARADNTIMNVNCAPLLSVPYKIRVQVLRGLEQTLVWDGPAEGTIDLNNATSLDALVTVWLWLDQTTLDTLAVTSSMSSTSCVQCQTETLVSNGLIANSQACHLIGSQDAEWMDSYLGATATIQPMQPPGATVGLWLRPTWKGPYCNMKFTLKKI